MSDELTKDFVDDWKQKIRAGIAYRKKYSRENHWKDFRKMYRGDWKDKITPVNKIFSYGRMLVPKVYFRAPRVTITATHPSMVAHARLVEAIDALLIRELTLKRTLKKGVIDTYLCGVSPIKLGFDSEFGYVPDQSIDADGSTVSQTSKKDGDFIEYRENVKPGMPWALRCQPEDVIVPWGTEDASNLQWVAHRILRPLDDIKQDAKYKNTSNLVGTRTPDVDGQNREVFRPKEDQDKDILYGELFEIRDARSRRMITICEDEVLLNQPDPLQIDGLPYEFLVFNDDPQYFWGVPDAFILQPLQKELNDTTTQISSHRGISLLKFLVKKGALSEAAKQALLSGEVGPLVEVESEIDNIMAAVYALQPHIPPDLYQAATAAVNGMRESLGFSSMEQFAGYQGTPRSASETMTVTSDLEQRISERRDILGDSLASIVRKWNQFIFKFWTTEKVVRVVGPEGEWSWVRYTGDQLRGEYNMFVDPDSGMPMSRALKMQSAKDMFGTFNGDPMVDQVLLREILIDAYAGIDPRSAQLLSIPMGMDPKMLAAARQPSPAGMGPGKGSGGGRAGSSPSRPEEFDSFRKRFEAKSEQS